MSTVAGPGEAAIRARAAALPDPWTAPGDEPVAVGEDLSVLTLLAAYRVGLFPWPAGGLTWWWSPDPRAVLDPMALRLPRTVRRRLARRDLTTTVDQAFDAVVAACAERPGEGTWITPAMRSAYGRLHALGRAHSVEVWDGRGRLVGGLYGVATGGVLTGESMFHRADDAGTAALVDTVRRLRAGGLVLLDVQQDTPHLRWLGARPWPRERFLATLAAHADDAVTLAREPVTIAASLAALREEDGQAIDGQGGGRVHPGMDAQGRRDDR